MRRTASTLVASAFGVLLLTACVESPSPSAPAAPTSGSEAGAPAAAGEGIWLHAPTVRETAAGAIAAAREIHERNQAAALAAAKAGSEPQAPTESRRDAATRAVNAARELTEQGAAPIARGSQKSVAAIAVDSARTAGGEQVANGSDAAKAAERHANAEALRAIEDARRMIAAPK